MRVLYESHEIWSIVEEGLREPARGIEQTPQQVTKLQREQEEG